MYFTDDSTHQVLKLTASTNTLSVIAGNAYAGVSQDNIRATMTPLYSPANIWVDTVGNVYFIDIGPYAAIRKVDITTSKIHSVIGSVATSDLVKLVTHLEEYENNELIDVTQLIRASIPFPKYPLLPSPVITVTTPVEGRNSRIR